MPGQRGGPNQSELESDGVRVEFAAGEREKVVSLPLKSDPGEFYRVVLEFIEADRTKTARAFATHRRIALDIGDSAHAIRYSAVPDGDPKSVSHQVVEVALPSDVPPFIDGTGMSMPPPTIQPVSSSGNAPAESVRSECV